MDGGFLQGRQQLVAIVGALGALALVALGPPAPARAQGSGAIQALPGCTDNSLPRELDASTPSPVPLGFTADFFGNPFTDIYVNENGTVSFFVPSYSFTPYDFSFSFEQLIAPFWADVDIRDPGSGVVTYGQTTVDGAAAFCVNWIDVGYHDVHVDKLNSFQLVLVSRGISPGDFDIIFNYGKVQWETGDDSGGVQGFGGTSAAAGYSRGDGDPAHSFLLPGSIVPGSFLDSNPSTGLIYGSRMSSTPGRYVFEIRNAIPELATSVAVGVLSGTVRVREKGAASFHDLEGSETLPVGSSIDTTQGHAWLASATPDGGSEMTEYFDGVFSVNQKPSGLTDIKLETNARACRGASRTARGSGRVLNRLFGRGGGRTRTKGRGGAGTVRGTFWLTEDRCDGTLFKVTEGVVKVRDFARKRNVTLRAGDKYLARVR